MKLTGSKTEDAIRAELRESQTALHSDPEQASLLAALKARFPDMTSAFVLGWTPEQGEDIYRVLVDASTIAAVEIERPSATKGNPNPPVLDIIDLAVYRHGLSRHGRIKLAVALDMAAHDMATHKARLQERVGYRQ